MLSDEYLARVLYIDLSKKRFHVEKRTDLFEKYLGGAGVAIQLLKENCPEDLPVFHKDNPIVFAIGPLTGLFPLASKTVAMFKSPHTHNLGESHCGGRSAVSIRLAGYGAVVITGVSDIPIYLSIHDGIVQFKDASTLWGMGNSFVTGRIIRENESDAGTRTIMRIGEAGENLVSYATVTTETYRHFGRLGLGAVFGSKNLKAVVVSGRRSIQVPNGRKYRTQYDEIYNSVVRSEIMKKYYELGTAVNIKPLNKLKGLPTRNLSSGMFEHADQISGEAFASNYLGRRIACSHCPVACIHIAAYREPYEDEAYFYKTSMISYDYEPIYAIGSMLGISKPDGLLRLMDQIETVGLDVMSAGVVLAWATEAMEKGEIDLADTAGIDFQWGDDREYARAIKQIVIQGNDFYKALSHGVEYAASKYGGEDYALALAGNEMPGYHTGPAAHIGVLIGARHSHLDNAGYSLDQKVLMTRDLKPGELVDSLIAEEQWRQVLSSLVTCFFARGVYIPETVLQLLESAGIILKLDDLTRIGIEIHREKIKFKIREGYRPGTLRIPSRIFKTPASTGNVDESYMREALDYFNNWITEKK